MLTIHQVMYFFEMLDNFDKVIIEENQDGENVTFDAICHANSGNNCLHFQIIHNNHRIVIQTYKYMDIPETYIDIVQGNPGLEEDFLEFVNYLNLYRKDFTDSILNKLFVIYCGMWQKHTMLWHGETDSLYWEFGPLLSITWVDNKWFINTCDASTSQTRFLLNFIDSIEEICQ